MGCEDKEIQYKAKELQRKYHRAWREKNKEHIKKYHAKWRKENPDKVKQNNINYWERQVKANE